MPPTAGYMGGARGRHDFGSRLSAVDLGAFRRVRHGHALINRRRIDGAEHDRTGVALWRD